MLRLRPIEDVLEIKPNGIITKQVCRWSRCQDQRIEAAPLALLIGDIIVKRSSESRPHHVEGSLTEGVFSEEPQTRNQARANENRFHLRNHKLIEAP